MFLIGSAQPQKVYGEVEDHRHGAHNDDENGKDGHEGDDTPLGMIAEQLRYSGRG